MFKLIGWLGKMVLSAALVSTLSIYVAWTTVQVYADKLMKQFSLGNQTEKADFSEVLSKLSQNLNILKQPLEKDNAAPASKPANSSVYDKTGDSAGAGGSAGETGAKPGDGNPAAQTPQEHVPDNALPVMSHASSADSQKSLTEQQKQTVLSAEAFTKMKDEMTAEDKMKVFTILVNRLPQNELQKISGYAEDGLTEEEMTDVQMIVEKYVEPGELDELMTILKKY